MSTKLERGQFADFLRRYLGMTGSTEVAGDLAPELSPVLVLEAERPEWEFLKANRLMACAYSIGPTAGSTSAHRLRNPTGSGVVAIVTYANFAVEVTSPGTRAVVSASRNPDTGDLSSNTPTIARDTRYPGVNTSALIGSAQTVGLTGNTWWSTIVLNDVNVEIPVPFVLTPGNQLQLTALQNDVILRGSWIWLEKRLDALEAS